MSDDIDWNSRPYVTALDLMQMPKWKRQWFDAQPNIWRSLRPELDVLHNCAHPDNRDLLVRDMIREVRARAA